MIARAAAHDRISTALRSARARAGLSAQEVVDLLRRAASSISVATLERWEHTGGIRLEEAVDLAAVYHMSLDELAGPRAGPQPLPRSAGSGTSARRLTAASAPASARPGFRPAVGGVHRGVAYLVECRTSSLEARCAPSAS